MKINKLFEVKDDWSDLPQDLTKMTTSQEQRVVTHLNKKKLKELKKMLDITQAQLKKAVKGKDDLAIKNLQTREDILIGVIAFKEFGD